MKFYRAEHLLENKLKDNIYNKLEFWKCPKMAMEDHKKQIYYNPKEPIIIKEYDVKQLESEGK